MALLEYLKKLRSLSTDLAQENRRIIPIILCEDISSAFESVDHEAIIQYIGCCFNSGTMDLQTCVKSYLDRSANSYDRDTKQKLPVTKRHRNRSTPQGSLVSPFLWRIFDNLFTQLYLNSTTGFKNQAWVHDVFHVSYADDHLTCVAIIIDDVVDDSQAIKLKTKQAALLLRELFDCATREVGCGINRAKSEVILAKEYENEEIESKDEFVWLGYSLRLDHHGFLKFTESRMKQRFQATRLAFENTNQYLTNIAVKRKIWEVYVSSVIEWFLPVIGYHRRDNLASINSIESFQNSTLSTALNISKYVGRKKINSIAVTKPVIFKLRAMGKRLKKHTARTSAEIETILIIGNQGVDLRTGKQGWCAETQLCFNTLFCVKSVLYVEKF